jgi:hypothetical protein
METFWGIVSLLLGIGFIATVALLGVIVLGGFFSVKKAAKQAEAEREKSRVELSSFDSEAIRSRLLNYSYFTSSLRTTPTLQNFLSRIENREEKLLASDWRASPKNLTSVSRHDWNSLNELDD